jgi:MYXO-CTERM domain-containing protein
MRRLLIPVAVAAFLSVGSVAAAQTTPTVPDDDEIENVVDDEDDESDKTGLWGLLGLLGLAGLAGLKRKRDDYSTGTTRPVTGAAPKRADGATGTGTNP